MIDARWPGHLEWSFGRNWSLCVVDSALVTLAPFPSVAGGPGAAIIRRVNLATIIESHPAEAPALVSGDRSAASGRCASG
jgi:hypothetical protein